MNARDILIVDDEHLIRELLGKAMEKRGHTVRTAADGAEALAQVAESVPDLLLLDLMLPRMDGFQVLQAIRSDERTRAIQVIVLTAKASQSVLKEALSAGADDYISKPFHLGEVLSRVDAHMRIAQYSRRLERQREDWRILLDISHRLTRHLNVQGILQDVTGLVASVLSTDRCSVVLVEDAERARVVAASDGEGLINRVIELSDYPEIRWVLRNLEPLVVADITNDPLFDPVKEQLSRLHVQSAALFPLKESGRCIGALFLRSTTGWERFEDRELQLGQIIANATAIAVTNARLVAEIQAETEAISHARAVVAARLENVERYEAFFENAADGMFITDMSGRVIFMNRQAERVVGSDATGRPFVRLCVAGDRERAAEMLTRAAAGEVPERLNLHVGKRIVSASAALVKAEEVISLTVRDVTEEIAVSRELERAREKLAESEKLHVLAELAGTTAHELNQPLTSVLGYAELLQRRLGPDDPNYKAAVTIEAQARRMAGIVKRLGRITRYETKPYVGEMRILDLDLATDGTSGSSER